MFSPIHFLEFYIILNNSVICPLTHTSGLWQCDHRGDKGIKKGQTYRHTYRKTGIRWAVWQWQQHHQPGSTEHLSTHLDGRGRFIYYIELNEEVGLVTLGLEVSTENTVRNEAARDYLLHLLSTLTPWPRLSKRLCHSSGLLVAMIHIYSGPHLILTPNAYIC